MPDFPEDVQPPVPPEDGPEDDAARQSIAITLEQVQDVLEHGGPLEAQGMLRWSSNTAFLVTVTKDDLTIPAVYKPQRGERPLWDFPDGTLCQREYASYLTSEALGWHIVPPTALREGEYGLGSVQFFIDHDPEDNYFSFDAALAPQLARVAVFDVLINNADRKGGHLLLDGQGRIWGIDQGLTFNRDHKLRTVIWDYAGQPVPVRLLNDVEHLRDTLADDCAPYTQRMCELLATREFETFRQRIERLLRTRRYPTPGPGPNYPWPAI